jgi:hypothetical protein
MAKKQLVAKAICGVGVPSIFCRPLQPQCLLIWLCITGRSSGPPPAGRAMLPLTSNVRALLSMKQTSTALFLVLLASCGGGDSSSTPNIVSYDGTTLFVRSVRYERSPENTIRGMAVCEDTSTCYVGGEILVTARNSDDFARMSAELDLPVTSNGPGGLTMPVPRQYERQWVRALLNEPAILNAKLELVVR